MSILVELFGIPRSRAGVERMIAEGQCLGDVLLDLARQNETLAAACIHGRQLRTGFTANLDGDRFITAPDTPLHEGDTIFIMSLDAGG